MALTCPDDKVYMKFVTSCGVANGDQFDYYIVVNKTKQYIYQPECKSMNQLITEEGCYQKSEDSSYHFYFHTLPSVYISSSYVSVYDDHESVLFKVAPGEYFTKDYIFYYVTPIVEHSSILYTSEYHEDWYKSKASTTEWSSIIAGSEHTPVNEEYYRSSFTVESPGNYAAFNLILTFKGTLTLYINDMQIWQGKNDIDTESGVLFPVRLILSANCIYLQNILAIKLIPSTSEPFLQYIDMYMVMQAISEPNNCAYTLPPFKLKSIYSTSLLAKFYDMKISTQPELGNNDNIDMTLIMKNNTYLQINTYRMVGALNHDGAPREIILKARDNDEDPWIYLDTQIDVSFIDDNITFPVYANNRAFKQYQFFVRITNSNSFSARENFIFTCRQDPDLYRFEYKEKDSILAKDIQMAPLIPKYSGYSNITIEPELPRGLSFDSYSGRITGTPIELADKKEYILTAHTPFLTTFKLSITVNMCTSSILYVHRYYAKGNKDEEFEIYSKPTPTEFTTYIVYDKAYLDQKERGSKDYYFCVKVDDYALEERRIGQYTSTSWDAGSFISIYLYTHPTYNADSLKDLNYYQKILQSTYHKDNGQPFIFSTKFMLPSEEQFKYLESSSIPNDWFKTTFDDSNWSTIKSSQHNLTSPYTILRKVMSIPKNEDLLNMLSIQLLYTEGIIIYLNENMIFANHVTLPIQSNSLASGSYDTIEFRQITLPANIFHEEDNLLSILLLSQTEKEAISVAFDITIRTIGVGLNQVLYDVVGGRYDSLFDHDYSGSVVFVNNWHYDVYFKSKTDDFVTLSSYGMYVHSSVSNELFSDWTFQCKNSVFYPNEKEGWQTLDVRQHVEWSVMYERRTFYIQSPHYLCNEFRFIDMIPFSMARGHIAEIELYSESLNNNDIKLQYTPSSQIIYVNAYMTKMIPDNYSFFHSYTIEPALPEGITMSNDQGVLIGLSHTYTKETEYTIKALTPLGIEVSTKIKLSVYYCENNKSLYTLDLYIPDNQRDMTLYLYVGGETSYNYIYSEQQISSLYGEKLNPNSTEYTHRLYPFCLDFGYYHFSFSPRNPKKFVLPAGYSINNESNTTIIMGGLNPDTKSSVIVYFDASMPLQNTYSSWYYMNTDTIDNEWKESDYDISKWYLINNHKIESKNKKYYLLRSKFTIANLTEHSSLDIKMTIKGSFKFYINTVLYYEYKDTTDSIKEHLIILPVEITYLKSNNNVLSILNELVNPSLSSVLYIDMAYKRGTETRLMNNFVIDNYDSSTIHNINNLFNYNFFDYTQFDASENQSFEIIFNDDSILSFNSIAIQAWTDQYPKSISIYGREKSEYDWTFVLKETKLNFKYEGSLVIIKCNKGTAKFKYLNIIFNEESDTKTPFVLSELSFSYSNYKSVLCLADSGFPSVGEDQYSYKLCGYGMQGTMYRYCDGLKLGKVYDDDCFMLPPSNLTYPYINYVFSTYTNITTIKPSYTNLITSFNISSELPSGLLFNNYTGEISGLPTTLFDDSIYTITGINNAFSTQTIIHIQVVAGECTATQEYPSTTVFTYASIPCGSGEFGSRTRYCDVQNNIIQWRDHEDNCTNIAFIATLVSCFILCCIIVALLYIIRKHNQIKETERQNRKKVRGSVQEHTNASGYSQL